MGKVQDIIAALTTGENGIEYPEDFLDQIQVAYDDDFSIPAARIEQADAGLAEANTIIGALKAHNYDLLMAVGSVDDSDSDTGDGGSETEDDDSLTTASLFDTDKDED